MSISSRREFFTRIAAATVVAAVPASAQTDKKGQAKKTRGKLDKTTLPLAVDIRGPMLFRWSTGQFELWMPKLAKEHQAGIMTSVTGIEIKAGDYKITGPLAALSSPISYYQTQGGKLYAATGGSIVSSKKYICMSLPTPTSIALLDPVPAKIYATGSTAPTSDTLYAVGLRIFYNQAGAPTLHNPDGSSRVIPLDPSPADLQTNMLIGYEPYDSCDPNHNYASQSFKALGELLGLSLEIEFGDAILKGDIVPMSGPLHDCKSPIVSW